MLFNTLFILNTVTCILAFGEQNVASALSKKDTVTYTSHNNLGGIRPTVRSVNDTNSLLYEPPLNPLTWVDEISRLTIFPGPYCISLDDPMLCTLSTLRNPTQQEADLRIFDNGCTQIGFNASVGLPFNHTDLYSKLNFSILITKWDGPALNGPTFLYAGRNYGWEVTDTYGYNGGPAEAYPHTIVATRQVFNCSGAKS
jgi:hypothetical protein